MYFQVTDFMPDVTCPSCGTKMDVCLSEYDDPLSDMAEVEAPCYSCGRPIKLTAHVTFFIAED